MSYATQINAIQRNAHPDLARSQRFKDPQASNQELKDQSSYCETRMGRRQHQRGKEVARTALHNSRQPHDEFCRNDVWRRAL